MSHSEIGDSCKFEREAAAYAKFKNLKLAADSIGIKWQILYTRLTKIGVAVTGDKARYGCAKDRLAAHAEMLFSEDVPIAINANEKKFQASIDFDVAGFSVDVKASTIHERVDRPGRKKASERWSFCINKQKDAADFFVLYAYEKNDSVREVRHVFLIPREIATTSSLISIATSLKSKWADYMVQREDLLQFFSMLSKEAA